MLDPLTRYLLRDAGRHGPVALMYHSVGPDDGPRDWPWAISQHCFREHLAVLRDTGWTTVRLSDLTAGSPLPPRAVAITFDDGYRDNLAALDLLSDHGMVATWFAVSGALAGQARWLDGPRATMPLLSGADLRRMADAGMEVGSHSRSHPRLPQLDAQALEDEVAGSRRELEDVLGREVASFAYPFGAHDDRVVQAVARAGYRAACTTRSGWALKRQNPLLINRLTVYAGEGGGALARKLALGTNEGGWGAISLYQLQRLGLRAPVQRVRT